MMELDAEQYLNVVERNERIDGLTLDEIKAVLSIPMLKKK